MISANKIDFPLRRSVPSKYLRNLLMQCYLDCIFENSQVPFKLTTKEDEVY